MLSVNTTKPIKVEMNGDCGEFFHALYEYVGRNDTSRAIFKHLNSSYVHSVSEYLQEIRWSVRSDFYKDFFEKSSIEDFLFGLKLFLGTKGYYDGIVSWAVSKFTSRDSLAGINPSGRLVQCLRQVKVDQQIIHRVLFPDLPSSSSSASDEDNFNKQCVVMHFLETMRDYAHSDDLLYPNLSHRKTVSKFINNVIFRKPWDLIQLSSKQAVMDELTRLLLVEIYTETHKLINPKGELKKRITRCFMQLKLCVDEKNANETFDRLEKESIKKYSASAARDVKLYLEVMSHYKDLSRLWHPNLSHRESVSSQVMDIQSNLEKFKDQSIQDLIQALLVKIYSNGKTINPSGELMKCFRSLIQRSNFKKVKIVSDKEADDEFHKISETVLKKKTATFPSNGGGFTTSVISSSLPLIAQTQSSKAAEAVIPATSLRPE